MGGGLLQLIAVGQIDEFLSINPDLSFYQYVYKRHTSFAMESRQLSFQKMPVLAPSNTGNIYDCTIIRYGDLLNGLFFCFQLPEIYSSDKYRFKWIQNVGTHIIKKASVYIDGILIDQLTGEWMNIWNELSLSSNDTKTDSVIGNFNYLQNPTLSVPRVTIKNNKFIYNYYPTTTKESNVPSIPSHNVVIPLNFWFTRNPALALPILRLQLNVVTVRIELESSEKLYQVYASDLEIYVSPAYFNDLYGESINIYTFTKPFSIYPYIEANFVFLGEDERNTLFLKSKLTYLVEQLTINTPQAISSSSSASFNINVIVNNPTKELIWTLKRDDYVRYNELTNYSAYIPENPNAGILDKAILKFNNNNRFEEKSAEYFHMIQPYQYHSKIPRQGIYTYSFAIYPEKEFISGYFNAAVVKTTLSLNIKNIYDNSKINKKLVAFKKAPYEFNYLATVYCLNYNIFEIVGNQAGLKFTIST